MSTSTWRRRIALAVVLTGGAITLSSVGVVRAAHVNPDKNMIFHCDSGRACVGGDSRGARTVGVFGSATADDAVQGITGSTRNGAGVAGFSANTLGTGRGVYGRSSNGPGIVGVAERNEEPGVIGLNPKGIGVVAESSASPPGVALYAHAHATHTNIFVGFNQANFAHCIMDDKANFSCTGHIRSSSALRVQHRNAKGARVLTYGSESATATIEDVGTSRMLNGVANVQIDPAFSAVMDRGWYYVFLTPLGDTRGLYVSNKTPTAFQVRETQGGRSKLAFDYRIVARPLNAPSDRLTVSPPDPQLPVVQSSE